MKRKPAAGEITRIGRELAQIFSAVLPVKFEPSVDSPGHGYAQRTRGWYTLQPLFSEIIDARLGWRWAAGINRLDFAGLVHKDQRKKISSRSTSFGLHYSHHERRRKCRIDSIANFLQDSNPG